jgi:hypothetical protein
LDVRLADAVFTEGLDPFREILRVVVFTGFAFKRTDLPADDDRLDAFLVALGFDFAFVAIDAATYNELYRLKSRHPLADELQISSRVTDVSEFRLPPAGHEVAIF